MDSARMQLLKGAVKSGIAALSGSTIGATLLDPTKFTVTTWPGIKSNLILGAIVVGAAEIRYLGQWLSKWSDSSGS